MNEQETTADIIAAMRGGPIPQHRHDRVLLCHFADRLEAAHKRDHEYPKAQSLDADKLMGKNISGLVTELRQIAKYHYARGNIVQGQFARVMADRFDAAHKREVQDALDTGGFVGAMLQKKATTEKSSAVGDCAKLREALSKFCAYSAVVLNTGMFNRVHLEALLNMAKAALAKPVRNCERFRNADEALEALERHCNSSGNGCIRCPVAGSSTNEVECKIAWLFAPATEKEGGDK